MTNPLNLLRALTRLLLILLAAAIVGSVIGIIRGVLLDNMGISWFIRLVKK